MQAKDSSQQILNINALYNWTKTNDKKTEVFMCSKKQIENAAKKLKKRFEAAEAVPGIQKTHSFVINETEKFISRKFSTATKYLKCPNRLNK